MRGAAIWYSLNRSFSAFSSVQETGCGTRPLSSTPWMQRTPLALPHELHARRSHATTSRAHEVAEVEKSSPRVNPARLVAANRAVCGPVCGRPFCHRLHHSPPHASEVAGQAGNAGLRGMRMRWTLLRSATALGFHVPSKGFASSSLFVGGASATSAPQASEGLPKYLSAQIVSCNSDNRFSVTTALPFQKQGYVGLRLAQRCTAPGSLDTRERSG